MVHGEGCSLFLLVMLLITLSSVWLPAQNMVLALNAKHLQRTFKTQYLPRPHSQAWTKNILDQGQEQANNNPHAFHAYCMSFNFAGTVFKPFWDGFPLCNINQSITPDILHQLYQGVFKHLVSWCQQIMTPGELDACIQCFPLCFGLREFKNGISSLS